MACRFERFQVGNERERGDQIEIEGRHAVMTDAKPGDQVVIAGKAALREGSAVQVIGQDKKPATVAKAPADGYTLLFGTMGTQASRAKRGRARVSATVGVLR